MAKSIFDDEAYVDVSTRRIVVTSVNYYGLLDIKDMLSYLGINCKIYVISKGYAYRLIISNRRNISKFTSNITLLHPLKMARLKQIASTP